MALLKLNGQTHFLNVDSVKVEPVSNGRWEVTFDDANKFLVIGGRKSGGARNEWFCYRPSMFGEQWVPCNSMIKAIKLGCCY